MRSKLWLLFLSVLPLLLVACRDTEASLDADVHTSTYRVAVVMPASVGVQWERTAAWAQENIAKAQQGLPRKVKMDIEWIDEDDPMWLARVQALTEDSSCAAIIGPFYSAHARKAAVAVVESRTGTPLVVPVANSAELQRIYGRQSNVWFLCQSNLTQCEILLTQAKLCGNTCASLIASNDDFGSGFSDWFAYLAIELGLEVDKVHIYANNEELSRAVEEEYTSPSQERKALLFAPGSEAHALVFDSVYTCLRAEGRLTAGCPELLCADVLHSAVLGRKLRNNIYEGISPTADPESGFLTAFASRFGQMPVLGEAHLYDALLLTAYALALSEVSGASMSDCLRQVTERTESVAVSWFPADTHRAFAALRSGQMVNVDGVTGEWEFDEKNRSTMLHTTYAHWMLENGVFYTLDYLSTEGGHHASSTMQAWEWLTEKTQQFNHTQADFDYPDLHDRHAVVVATSDTWPNYRHQADALAMYRLLLRHGYTENQITYITEDNIAYHPNNLYPGCVRVEPDGANLYGPAPTVDYLLSETTINDFRRIMQGFTPNDNVIVFWCGHGGYGRLAWGSDGEVHGSEVRDILEGAQYRKLMFVVDACYSGSLGEACEGLPGALFITAANSREPSKADMRDTEMGLWLSNGFTRAFQDAIDTHPSQSLHELYTTLARRTVGSHVTVYNEENYGNMYNNSLNEFLPK